MKFIWCTTYFFVVLLTSCADAPGPDPKSPEITKTEVKAELFVDNLQNPWGMAFLPDGSLLVAEKSGTLLRISNGERREIGGLPAVKVQGQGGLMDIRLHPDYDQNGWLYFSFASADGEGEGAHTAIMRAKLEGDRLLQNELLYKGSPNTRKGQHFGSRITFDREGYMYFSIGDRGNRDVNPQDLARDGGKIYRLYDDGRIPEDNPFVGQEGARTAIFSYGHRNPQGLVTHPETGEIWETEHGPRGGDELNLVKKGKNYGWPVITYGINYSGTPITDETHREGMEQPLHYWVPSIAPCGMEIVSSDKYPGWEGNILIGSLSFQYLEMLVMDGYSVAGREKLLENIGRVRNVIQGPDGFIYVGVESKGIYRLIPQK